MILSKLNEKCKRTIYLYQIRNSTLYHPRKLLEMKKELLWKLFEKTGKIEYYLKYKEGE